MSKVRKTISVFLPKSLIKDIKYLAGAKYDVSYKSLMKMFLVERVEKELGVAKYSRVPH